MQAGVVANLLSLSVSACVHIASMQYVNRQLYISWYVKRFASMFCISTVFQQIRSIRLFIKPWILQLWGLQQAA